MAFEQVVVLGAQKFDSDTRRGLQSLARAVAFHEPLDAQPTAEERTECDALMVSLGVEVPAELLATLPKLRYVGLFGTNLAPIDVEHCRARGIAVTNIVGYCDRETAEFCLLRAMHALRGFGDRGTGSPAPARSIAGRRLGIVGVGSVGRELAILAKGVGFEVSYLARSRKRELEQLGLHSRALPAVLRRSDVVSLHLPPTLQLLGAEEFEQLSPETPLINTCLGLPYELAALEAWLERGGHLIVDQIAGDLLGGLREHPGVAVVGVAAYATRESIARRREIFLAQARPVAAALDDE